jgi:hypothetical protein
VEMRKRRGKGTELIVNLPVNVGEY